ncbi:MAG TPA: anhydro-N-acetylmuramic acid kinase [Bacteroidia bacterium]|jgi:anhydro-N-acetylmuramic acid kinase|nr:anhydro-N-acetylmuramic acid kinase [Bacteroidia bacterium]
MAESKKVLGLMSGTSLDGLDLALVNITEANDGMHYEIVAAETIEYDQKRRDELINAKMLSGEKLFELHHKFGVFLGESSLKFLQKHQLSCDLIASHGHTIFHQPANGFTTQIGHGAAIAAVTGITTVCDFRSIDVALGGQGAPLVPIGDELFFGMYDYCLNLGGIANISFRKNLNRIAFDICPVNMALNYLANACGQNYDAEGKIAASGKLNTALLDKLNALEFYRTPYPRSLGVEWFNEYFLPVLNASTASLTDKTTTVTHHIAKQIGDSLTISDNKLKSTLLVTGGGSKNKFLVQKIQENTSVQIIIPDEKIIDFKEALIFALLGYLRINNHKNTLATVTGAKKDSVGGAVYLMA